MEITNTTWTPRLQVNDYNVRHITASIRKMTHFEVGVGVLCLDSLACLFVERERHGVANRVRCVICCGDDCCFVSLMDLGETACRSSRDMHLVA
jgi:hypothetical protein